MASRGPVKLTYKIIQHRAPWSEDVVAEKDLGEELSGHPIPKGKITLAKVGTGCKLVVLGLNPIQRHGFISLYYVW